MATNTLLQYLESGEGVATSNRRQVETFIAAGAIVKEDAVSLDMSQAVDGDIALKVVKSNSGAAAAKAFVGVALNAGEAGSLINVVVQGVVNCNVHTSTVAGSILQISTSVGRLEPRTVAVDEGASATFNLYPICGIATENEPGPLVNQATIIVYKQGI
jgi:hypothetical protein